MHGRIRINGRDIANASARQAIRHGVAHVPEDRTGVGSAPKLSVADNLIMNAIGRRRSPRAGWSTRSAPAASPKPCANATQSPRPSIDTEARLLSGGNLQRLILAREIESDRT